MNETSELYNSPLRGILYGIMELGKDRDGDEVVAHMAHNIPDFYNQREVVIELADYLSKRLEPVRPDEASSARVLRDLVRNQRL
jgi:putative DNA methylase